MPGSQRWTRIRGVWRIPFPLSGASAAPCEISGGNALTIEVVSENRIASLPRRIVSDNVKSRTKNRPTLTRTSNAPVATVSR